MWSLCRENTIYIYIYIYENRINIWVKQCVRIAKGKTNKIILLIVLWTNQKRVNKSAQTKGTDFNSPRWYLQYIRHCQVPTIKFVTEVTRPTHSNGRTHKVLAYLD